MSQSVCKIYLHVIFHIKTTSPAILNDDLDRLHAYLGQLINDAHCTNIWVDGVEDHVHALILLGREVAISHLIEEIKRNSSRWIKSLSPHYRLFEWQGGYAAMSVSQSVVEPTLEYIKNQRTHHKRMSFQDEYVKFLELYHIDYDPRYVFKD